jgi:histidinol-phosphate/aromatic aminotransferase/cobyric acid decarboxylase-like protein
MMLQMSSAQNGRGEVRSGGHDEAESSAPAPSELLRGDLRELAPFPGGAAATVRYRPGAEVRAALEGALAANDAHRANTDLGAASADEVRLLRRARLTAAIAAATGVAGDEIVPFGSLATLFTVVFSGFPRSRDRQPASVMIPAPARSLYKWCARAAGLKVVEVPLDAELRPDVAMMTRAFGTLRPSVIVLGAPHDGSGLQPDPAALEQLLVAARGEALVVLDESFALPEESRRMRRSSAPHLVVVRSLEPWLAPDLASSWLELAPDLARALEVFPAVARPELPATAVAAGEALLGGTTAAAAEVKTAFAREVSELVAVHERLRARLAQLEGLKSLEGRAPFVAVVHDEPVAPLLEEAARQGLPGITGGGVGRLARLSRIAVSDDAEADGVVALLTGRGGEGGSR